MDDPLSTAGGPSPDALFQRAAALHRDGRLEEAETLYRRLLAGRADLAGAQFNFGILLIQRGHAAAGTERLRLAVLCDPAAAHFQLALAERLTADGQSEAAVSAWLRGVRLRPGDGAATAALARARRLALFQGQTAALLDRHPEGPDGEEPAGGLAHGVAVQLAAVQDHYDRALSIHGATPDGVNVPDAAYHRRMQGRAAGLTLHAVAGMGSDWTVNDVGCGYGALFERLSGDLLPHGVRYHGYDISPGMIAAARERQGGDPRAVFAVSSVALWPADCSVALGTFSFTLGHGRAGWRRYVEAQLLAMARMSRRAVIASFLWRDGENLFGIGPDDLLPFVRRHLSDRAEALGDPADHEWILRAPGPFPDPFAS
ncbi:methyltransferase domain-containing protein (plasmid) [Azospirillum sp. 412522]|nr:methyltransferase [Azospirillum sp. 412522]MBY6266505.1 methyltransferase domain-containing protein [Azospirillum sp. 412522]